MLSPQDLENIVKITVRCLDDSLRKPKYRINPNILAGQCYVVSEAIYHMLGGPDNDFGLKPMQVTHEGDSHWFLSGPGVTVDPTGSQFDTPVPYGSARGKGFLTRNPSKRAQILMARVKDWIALKD